MSRTPTAVVRESQTRPGSRSLFTEAEWQDQLVGRAKGHEGLAIQLGWHVFHVRPGRQGGKRWASPISGSLGVGWPDLILVRGERILAVELKARPNKPTDDQLRVLAILAAAGVETFVWYPEDLEEAAAVLSR